MRQKFPDLFHLARAPEAIVADHFRLQGSNHVWDIEFSRLVQDWELVVVDSFMELLYSHVSRSRWMDSLCWTPSQRGIFEVRSFYSVLVQPTPQGNLPWKCVWKAKVPSRVAFFIWTAALGKILTTDNLRKKKGNHIVLVQYVQSKW